MQSQQVRHQLWKQRNARPHNTTSAVETTRHNTTRDHTSTQHQHWRQNNQSCTKKKPTEVSVCPWCRSSASSTQHTSVTIVANSRQRFRTVLTLRAHVRVPRSSTTYQHRHMRTLGRPSSLQHVHRFKTSQNWDLTNLWLENVRSNAPWSGRSQLHQASLSDVTQKLNVSSSQSAMFLVTPTWCVSNTLVRS